MKIIYLITFFSIFLLSKMVAQTRQIDSLQLILNKSKEDTNKVNILIGITRALVKIQEYDKASVLAKDALTLSEKIKFKKGEALGYGFLAGIYTEKGDYTLALKNHFLALKLREDLNDKTAMLKIYRRIGFIYKNQGNFSEALKNQQASLKISKEINDKFEIANGQGNIGSIYRELGNYSEALKIEYNCLKIYEELKETIEIIASYNSLGLIYSEQKNFPEALKNQLKTLKLSKAINDTILIAHAFNNISIVYAQLGNLDEALKYQLESLKIREKLNDIYGISSSKNNLGEIYQKQKKYSQALIEHRAALKIREDLQDQWGIAESNLNLGIINFNTKKYPEAKKQIEKAISISISLGSKELTSNCLNTASALDSATNDWKQAYIHHKLYLIYRDSLFNEESTRKDLKTQMQYEYDKKATADSIRTADEIQVSEAKLTASEAKLGEEKTKRYTLYGGLCFALIFSGVIFNRFKITQKQKVIIEAKEKETFYQKEVIEEKQKEIVDSINYAKRIQYTLLPQEAFLKKHVKNHFILFKPKDIVSGDFYWATQKDNKFFIAICDSTGHGVPGAFMSLLNISFLNEAINEKGILEPEQVLNFCRQRLIDNISKDGQQDGFDGVLMCFDELNNKLTYAAANTAPVIIHNNELIELPFDKLPVGKHERDHVSFTKYEADLIKGDSIYVFTDGLPDQFGGPKGKKFMYKRLYELLLSISDLPMIEQYENISSTLNDWKGNLEQVDDITVIGMKIL